MHNLAAHQPKKYLGQNFLIDHNIRNKIITACHLNQEDTVLEIGPGKGMLTKELARHVRAVIAVEKDGFLAKALQKEFEHSVVKIYHADFLEFPFEKLPRGLKVVGNLPYNVATAIIEKILYYRTWVSSFYFAIQWELGERIVAQPNSKEYSSLSCFVQYYGTPKILFKIKNTAFKPEPKVQSCFMQLECPPQGKFSCLDEQLLFKIIKTAFQLRRKTIANSLSPLLEKNQLTDLLMSLDIAPQKRAEAISLKEYVHLTNELVKRGGISTAV